MLGFRGRVENSKYQNREPRHRRMMRCGWTLWLKAELVASGISKSWKMYFVKDIIYSLGIEIANTVSRNSFRLCPRCRFLMRPSKHYVTQAWAHLKGVRPHCKARQRWDESHRSTQRSITTTYGFVQRRFSRAAAVQNWTTCDGKIRTEIYRGLLPRKRALMVMFSTKVPPCGQHFVLERPLLSQTKVSSARLKEPLDLGLVALSKGVK